MNLAKQEKAGQLQGKVAVITRIGSSMGLAAAVLVASEVVSVVGCDVDHNKCNETLEAIHARGGVGAMEFASTGIPLG